MTDSETAIRVTGPDEDARKIVQLAANCNRELQHLLPAEKPDLPVLNIQLDGSETRSRDSGEHLSVSMEDVLQLSIHRINLALIRRYGRAVTGEEHEPPEKNYDWLAAALTYRVIESPRSLMYRGLPNYEPVRILQRQGRAIPVKDLITTPVSPDNPLPYQLYAIHASLLMDCVQRRPKQDSATPVNDVIRLTFSGRPPVEALTLGIGDSAMDSAALKTWYDEAVRDVSRYGRRRGTAAQIVERMRHIQYVVIPVADKNGIENRTYPLKSLPKAIDEYDLGREFLFRLQEETFELAKDSPPLIAEAVLDYLKAFQALEKKQTWRYRRRLKRAEKNFKKQVERQREVEAYMDRMQCIYSPDPELFPYYFHAFRENQKMHRRLMPELHQYLDSLENAVE